MAVLKDFYCPSCQEYFEATVDGDQSNTQCVTCNTTANVVFLQFPGSKREYETDFTPHYDMTLGEHFQTKKEKDAFLKLSGREQVSGVTSPRSDTKLRKSCSRDQARKVWGIESEKPATPKARQYNPSIYAAAKRGEIKP